MKKSIFDEKSLDGFLSQNGVQKFRKKQIFQEIFKNQNIKFSEMTTLSKDLRDGLDREFFIVNLNSDKVLEDEETTKFGFLTEDGNLVEAVLMYHWSKKGMMNDEPPSPGGRGGRMDKEGKSSKNVVSLDGEKPRKLNRITLCISSQVGCPVGCDFCVTGKLGLTRNLTKDEMLGQILYANDYIKKRFGKKDDGTLFKVRNVVFMGMGEPLLNYDNLKLLFPYLLEQQKLSLSRRHITISTVGIISGIEKLIADKNEVMLAVSLHSPNQELREQLIPFAKFYPLERLLDVLDRYVEVTDNRIFYEYIMIKDVTDSLALAEELGSLLKDKLCHLNLIPYNENPMTDYAETSRNQIYRFKDVVESHGVTVTIRDSMGRSVKSACGQLGGS